MTSQPHCIAFVGQTRLAQGSLLEVARAIRQHLDAGELAPIAVFDAETSAPIDLDVRGTPDQAAARAEAQLISRESAAEVRPGRPKLGVVAREVTLLPRHWDWLGAQPGGASVTLRKLVDAARKQGHASERIRHTQDNAYRFMHAVGGDLPGFEEAVRALYAWDRKKLETQIADWPPDVADHVRQILER